jgi:hypothetical protein
MVRASATALRSAPARLLDSESGLSGNFKGAEEGGAGNPKRGCPLKTSRNMYHKSFE